MAESQAVPVRLKQLEEELAALQQPLNELLMSVPNLPHASAPLGESADDNVEVRRWLPAAAGPDGNPQPLAFEARDHVAVGEPLAWISTWPPSCPARASFMRGPIARLHRALAQFMLDLQTGTHGYTECYTPYIVNASTLYGTGQLPKFKDDMFAVSRAAAMTIPGRRPGQALCARGPVPDLDLRDHPDQRGARRHPGRCRAAARSPPIRRASVPRRAAAAATRAA